MLQTVHQKKGSARASSIYCQWIRREQGEDSPLVAIWVDSEMRSFEREFPSNSDTELLPEDALEEPGGAQSLQMLKQTMTTRMTVHL
jgi:hypothetical protein